ncbi:hypothetical protein JOQ06_004446, partial [Pogonophryne albipinna]
AGAIVIKQEVEYTPIKIDGSVEDVVGQESLTEEILHLEDTLKEARENVTRAQEKTRQHLKCSGKTIFKVGDKVWRQNKRSQQRKGGKFEPNCLGPFTIKSLQGKSADLQGEKGALIHKVNIDHLKHCKEEGPRIPHKIKDVAKQITRPSVIVFAGKPPSSPVPPAPGPAVATPTPASSPVPPAPGPAVATPTPPSSPVPPAPGPAVATPTPAACPRTCSSYTYTCILTSAACPRTSYNHPDPDSTRQK